VTRVASGFSPKQLVTIAARLRADGLLAEAADCLRLGLVLHPGDDGVLGAWRELEEASGGRLAHAAWFPDGDPEWHRTLALTASGAQ
jgi:hypothetical protein